MHVMERFRVGSVLKRGFKNVKFFRKFSTTELLVILMRQTKKKFLNPISTPGQPLLVLFSSESS